MIENNDMAVVIIVSDHVDMGMTCCQCSDLCSCHKCCLSLTIQPLLECTNLFIIIENHVH